MKIPTYKSTRDLESYPENERFAVYRAAHKQLMDEDADYRRRWNSYAAGIICSAIAPLGCYVVGPPYGIALSVVLPLLVAAAVILLAFHQQRFMNEKIGNVLQSSTN